MLIALDVQHRLWLLLMDGQSLPAPYSQLDSVLDLGCRSAVWAAAVARQFPKADLVGGDILPQVKVEGIGLG